MGGCHQGREPPGRGEWPGPAPGCYFQLQGSGAELTAKAFVYPEREEEESCVCICVWRGWLCKREREGGDKKVVVGDETMASAPGFDVETKAVTSATSLLRCRERPWLVFICVSDVGSLCLTLVASTESQWINILSIFICIFSWATCAQERLLSAAYL